MLLPADTASLTGIFAGLVLLVSGRRLYWLFVAGVVVLAQRSGEPPGRRPPAPRA